MTPRLWTRQSLRDKRIGSKRFSPKSTNGNGRTRIESNCRISGLAHPCNECKRLISTVDSQPRNL
jgi:hypothetical protein